MPVLYAETDLLLYTKYIVMIYFRNIDYWKKKFTDQERQELLTERCYYRPI